MAVNNMEKITIVLIEWMGYPLRRKKTLGKNKFKCGLGRILKNMDKYKAGTEFNCILIVNIDENNKKQRYNKLAEKYSFISNIFFRDNQGFDIGAYNYGYQYLKQQNYEGDILFMNSALQGPSHDNWLIKYKDLFHMEEKMGLCGITVNSHNTNMLEKPFMPHVQSFFLYSNISVLKEVFPSSLSGSEIIKDKNKLINEGEVGISQKILDAGYGICCSSFPGFIFRKNGEWTIPEGDIRFDKDFKKFINRI